MCIYFIAVLNFQYVFTAASFKMPEQELKQHDRAQWHGPTYPRYSSNNTRMQSYTSKRAISKQKAENLTNTGFFNTGKALHK
jgi:hypothetical protein